MKRTALASLIFFALVACGNEPQGKTTTKLDAVEVQPGTISDSMIILDDAGGDGTAVDNTVPDEGNSRTSAKKDDDSSGDSSPDEAAPNDEAKADPANAAKKAAPPVPAKKAEVD